MAVAGVTGALKLRGRLTLYITLLSVVPLMALTAIACIALLEHLQPYEAAWLADHGARDVVELDWWQAAQLRGVTFTCTPAQHSSGRGLRDQNLRLWSSWVIAGGGRKLWFAGDTGYTKSLGEIGKRLGPFDLAAIPVGGYSAYEDRHPNHVNPEEALQLFEDQHARLMVPIHFGTFDLNREPFLEPPTRLLKAAVARGLEEHVAILSAGQSIHW